LLVVVFMAAAPVLCEPRLEFMNWTQRGYNSSHTASVPWGMGPYFKSDTSPIILDGIIEGVATWGDQIIVSYAKEKMESKKTVTNYSVMSVSKGRQILWQTSLNSKPVGVPAVFGKSIIIQTKNGELVKLDAYKGKKLQEVKINPQGSTDVTICGKYAIFGGDNQVTCFDLNSNIRRWHFKAKQPPQPVSVFGSYVVMNHQESLSCVDLFLGRKLWEIDTNQKNLFSGTPVIGNGTVFISTVGGQLKAISLFTGNLLWEKPIYSVASVTFDKNRIYFPTNRGVSCFDARNGKEIWTSATFEKPIWAQILKTEKCLVVSSRDNFVKVLDPANGKELSKITIFKQVDVEMAVGNDFLVIPDNTYSIDKGNRLSVILSD
jgi:outer membrane protein assembly factor BamB